MQHLSDKFSELAIKVLPSTVRADQTKLPEKAPRRFRSRNLIKLPRPNSEVIDVYVPGRMEVVGERPKVVVDFAHNSDALQVVLDTLRPKVAGRLIVVTGSAGDRDADKRHAMGQAVANGADHVIITDEDPHSEDPGQIRAALLAGARDVAGASVVEVGDRREAIMTAIAQASDDDLVLIAGRGHETVQSVGDQLIELDDRAVAREALQARSQ